MTPRTAPASLALETFCTSERLGRAWITPAISDGRPQARRLRAGAGAQAWALDCQLVAGEGTHSMRAYLADDDRLAERLAMLGCVVAHGLIEQRAPGAIADATVYRTRLGWCIAEVEVASHEVTSPPDDAAPATDAPARAPWRSRHVAVRPTSLRRARTATT